MNKKYLAALAVFFAVMYVMIFVEHFFETTKIANVDTCTIEKQTLKTGRYSCIDAKAVRRDAMDNAFVYLVKEKKSILGNERICSMHYIDILEEDGAYVAVSLEGSALKDSDLIILHSDKELSQGSKVRMLEYEL
ncbi:MAG: hypothetical protein K2N87_02210 [Eubacterium sp.]|nr:hypothetical protein [Eubacterium sp.]